MTDGGAWVQPSQEEDSTTVRPRNSFLAHEVFGHGAGAVLVEPGVARDLRTAAEYASAERRIAGGLLYGRLWTDDEGRYLVIAGYLEAGPGEVPEDRIRRDGRDSFALTKADLRLLRIEASRVYLSQAEVGWWRSLPGPGEFTARDFESQRALVGPGGAGLLVFGSGLEWGTAYLGPDGALPGSARSFIPVQRPVTPPPATLDDAGEADEADLSAIAGEPAPWGAAVEEEAPMAEEDRGPQDAALEYAGAGVPLPASTPRTSPFPDGLKGRGGPRVLSPIRVPSRDWGRAKQATTSFEVEPSVPNDVKLVIAALIIVAIIAAIMIGALLSNFLIAVIAAVILLLGLSGFLWMSRL
jgi:hypothetical protein